MNITTYIIKILTITVVNFVVSSCNIHHVKSDKQDIADTDFQFASCEQTQVEKKIPFLQEFTPRKAPKLKITENHIPEPKGYEVQIKINPHKEIRKIPQVLYGNNAAVWLGREYISNNLFKKRVMTAGLALLRWPGGSTSDLYHWTGKIPASGEPLNWPDIHDHSWAPDTGKFLKFTKETGALPIIVVNHGYTSYGHGSAKKRLEKAVQMAADWVEYCNSPDDGSNPQGGIDWAHKRAEDGYTKPFKVKYWEIGNEVFGDWEIGHVSGEKYASHFIAFAEAMKNIDPSIYIGANVVVNFNTPGMTLWMKQLLSNKRALDLMDFADIHDYFKYVQTKLPKAKHIRKYYRQINEDKEELDRLFKKYAKSKPVPYFFGEFHLTHPQNPLNVTLASGLVVADVIGEFIKNGFAAAALWDTANEWKNGGDLGFITRNSPDVPDYYPYPAYYPFYMFSQKFGDTLIATDQNNWDIHIYGAKFSDNKISLIIVNPHDSPKTANVKIADHNIDGYVNAWILNGPDFMKSKIAFNGITTIHNHAGTEIKESYTLFKDIGKIENIKLPVLPNSVTCFIIY